MYKVLIVDDRLERKKALLDEDSFKSLKEFERDGVIVITSSLDDNASLLTKERIKEILEPYRVIAIHRSWLLQNNLINIFEEFIKDSDKFFIIFSGGTTTNGFSNNFRSLSINAGKFYTSKLLDFISDCENDIEPSLLRFLYGDSWRLPLLLEYRHLLWCDQGLNNTEKEEQLRALFMPDTEDVSIEYLNKQIEKEKFSYILL